MSAIKNAFHEEINKGNGEPQSFKEPIKVVFKDEYGQLSSKYCEILTFSHVLGCVYDNNIYICDLKNLISIQ